LENCIHDIGLKVDCDTFDQKIFELIALLNSINKGEKVAIPVQTGNNISSKDLQMIMEAIGKIDGLEALLNKLFEDMKNLDLDDIRRQLEQLWEKKADKKDVELLQSEVKLKVKSLEDAIAELKKMLIQTQAGVDDNKRQIETCVFRIDKCDQHITEIKKKLKELEGKGVQGGGNGGTTMVVGDWASPEDLKRLEKIVLENKSNIGKLRNDMNNGFNNFQEALNTKASYDDLDALEKKIMDKISALLQAL
jgi:flagellar biosynthesis chaperone FliJ